MHTCICQLTRVRCSERGIPAVRGNHEHTALLRRAERQRDASLHPRHAWTDELTPADVAWLEGLPLTLTLPAHNALVVHAGLVPGTPLEDQDWSDLLNLCVRG